MLRKNHLHCVVKLCFILVFLELLCVYHFWFCYTQLYQSHSYVGCEQFVARVLTLLMLFLNFLLTQLNAIWFFMILTRSFSGDVQVYSCGRQCIEGVETSLVPVTQSQALSNIPGPAFANLSVKISHNYIEFVLGFTQINWRCCNSNFFPFQFFNSILFTFSFPLQRLLI